VGWSVDETTALLRLANAKLDLLITRSETQSDMSEASAERERQMALDLTRLQQEVAANKDAVQSVVTVIDRLASQLEAEKEDPAAVQAIVDQLRANTQVLGQAVTKNTPADPNAATTTQGSATTSGGGSTGGGAAPKGPASPGYEE
jgi:SMC interacting uncharacterized protein involved in chromosome segregation